MESFKAKSENAQKTNRSEFFRAMYVISVCGVALQVYTAVSLLKFLQRFGSMLHLSVEIRCLIQGW